MQSKVDYTALSRLAIHYAHGIVQGSAELRPELLEYIQERGTHFLPYPGKEFDAEVYNEFYKKILP